MDNNRFSYLYEQYLTGRLTADELEEWKTALSQADLYTELDILVQDLWDRDDLSVPDYNRENALNIYREIVSSSNEEADSVEQNSVKLWPRIAAVAALFIAVCSISFFFLSKYRPQSEKNTTYVQDVAPGKTGATLTLANGKKIRLADAVNGEIAKESGMSVNKTAEGHLVYQSGPSSDKRAEKEEMNTLSTARGETYMVILPDKSTVWLNAATSLTYSAGLLDHGIRKVRLRGEAYFEIAKDKKHPFVVSTANHDVEVLGTHFNVNSYSEESSTTTTLLEGSVKVIMGKLTRQLKPNQQSIFTDGGFNVKNVNAEDAVAWKDGAFIFEDETLQSIMRRISRWYNVEVEYAENVDKDKLYGGGVSRYTNVSSVLEILESTKNIHFKVKGRRILVTK